MADPISNTPAPVAPAHVETDAESTPSGFSAVPSSKKKKTPPGTTPAPSQAATPAGPTPPPASTSAPSGFTAVPAGQHPYRLSGSFGTGRPAALAGTFTTQGLDLLQQGANLGYNAQGLYFLAIPTPQFQGGDSDSVAYEGRTYTQKAWDDYTRFGNAGLGVMLFYLPVMRGQQADTSGELAPILHPLGIPFDPQVVFGTDFHNDLGERLLGAESSTFSGTITNERMIGLMGKYLGAGENWADVLLLGAVYSLANGQSADTATDAHYLAMHPDAGFVQPYRYSVLEERFPGISRDDSDAILEALGNDDPSVLDGYVRRWEADHNQEIDDETLQGIILALDDEKIHLSVFPTLFMEGKLREASGNTMATANSGLAAQDLARFHDKFNPLLAVSMAAGGMAMSQTPNLVDSAITHTPFEFNPSALGVSGASHVLGAGEAAIADGDRHLLIAFARANDMAIRAYYDPKYYAYSGQFMFTGDNNNLMNSLFFLPMGIDGLSNLSTGVLMGDHLQQAVEDKDWREAMPFTLATGAMLAYDVHSLVLSQPKKSAVDAVEANDLDIPIHGNQNLWMPATAMSLTYGGGVLLGYFGVNDDINRGISQTLFGEEKTDPVTGAYLPGKKGITDFSISPTGPTGSNGPTSGATVGFKF